MHTHTDSHTHQSHIMAMRLKKRFLKRKVFREDLKELTGRMADRNRELVPDLVRYI